MSSTEEESTAVPYPARTQQEAVDKACAARTATLPGMTGWSSGREGVITQNDGAKLDVLLIEGWVPGLDPVLEMFVYYRKHPFRLLQGLVWKKHLQARNDSVAFMNEFKRGIRLQPFGQGCIEYLEGAEPANYYAL
jgi:hypothetical protein